MAKPKPTFDPLIAAMIAKLPPGGEPFPVEERLRWLSGMAMAFDIVHGAQAPVSIGSPLPGAIWQPPAPAKPALLALVPKAPDHKFYIDRSGYARNQKGEQIMPHDVTADEVLYDWRGETGDLGAIVWADGTQGVLGLQLEIAAA